MKSLYRRRSFRLASLWRLAHLTGAVGVKIAVRLRCVMSLHSKHEDRLARLADRLRLAQQVTPDLIASVIADACVRLPGLSHTAKAGRLAHLLDAGAWTEAALVLVELELPRWTLRRLVHEDGEWLCSLSKQPNLPAEFDDMVEARHEILPLAILSAALDARRHAAAAPEISAPTVPQVRSTAGDAVCCDNFA